MLLRDYLEQTKKSKTDFANELGVSPAAVSRWVSGDRFPRQYLQEIARVTKGKVTANDFVSAAA
jgi:predicted transcriptional regulator